MKIDVCKKKILPEMILSYILILWDTIIIIYFLWQILKTFIEYGVMFGFILSSMGVIFCALLMFLLLAPISTIRLLTKIMSLSISLENDCISFCDGSREWRIPPEKIKHILVYNKGTTLVWDMDGKIKTFFLRKLYFTRETYNEILKFLSNFGGYQDDLKENAKIRKQLGLDDIFRKNKLERELVVLRK